MVPARADRGAGPSSSSAGRQQELEADLGEEEQPNGQRGLELVHQQPQGVHSEDFLPWKRAQPQLAGPSDPARAQLYHSNLGARGAGLLQGHRPERVRPQAAQDAFRELGGHGAN